MKHPNEDFETAMKMTAISLPVCSARLAFAETASAISDPYVGIKLWVDAVTPNQRHWMQAGGSNCLRPVLREK